MNDLRFDDLARMFGQKLSRRRSIGAAIGLALGLGGKARQTDAQECGDIGAACGFSIGDCCGALYCDSSGTCVYEPTCTTEGGSCNSDVDCCNGHCCDGACHEYYSCCPTDPSTPSYYCAWDQYCDNNGVCQQIDYCGQDGEACTSDADCCQGICCDGMCQWSLPQCCISDELPNPRCGEGMVCNAGTCELAPTCLEEGASCEDTAACCTGLTCADGQCAAAEVDGSGSPGETPVPTQPSGVPESPASGDTPGAYVNGNLVTTLPSTGSQSGAADPKPAFGLGALAAAAGWAAYRIRRRSETATRE